MSTTPAVSILMPVRDAAATLDACLDSIRAQTFGDYELLVLDDASGDASGEIVAARARADARIRLPAPHGRGLVACLNAGLAAARAPLVARMDADDLMDRERIALQRKYLSEHPHVDLVASRVRAFPPEQVRAGMREYLRWQNACLAGDALREEIYVESPFAHASVMYRRDAVRAAGGYRDGDFPEDYELWLRLERIGCRMAKIDRCLLDWRQHDESLSRRDPRYSRDAFDRLRARYLLEDPRLAQGRPLVLWGAGRRTRRRARHFLAGGIVPAAWIDVDPRKLGHCIDGVPVVGPEWLEAQRPRPFVLTWVARHGARERIAAALDAMGYARGVDYLAVG
ncbi:MAG: glycosyltransferase [Gammaproteobacteria bacterium]|nr:glycosyltransferase [Gammaproteobacteria bacterium]NIM71995.1 glycosyltransferase [Gammaproteobacteria bacterium]NIN38403.1 glycosyltransferase [Gammaproteobacteria bacterium]NIO23722.1 glycosyltransferase [Gammaproteobacteria bacterium]NIO64364.1 glycosyltransferase [Gammaproteobacteria bacterium]